MSMRWTVLAAVAATLLAAPALADVKAGVDAWAKGDYRKAVDEWRGPAIAGDADAQFNLGQAYKLGRGVPIDLAMAEEWYRKAAQQGHIQASDNYGLALFQNGRRDQAVPWLEKSAARGEPRAQYVLGTMFFNGDVVKRDWVRAYALMTRSSAAGLDQASTTLAQMDRHISIGDRQKGTELARKYEADAGRPLQVAEVASAAPRPARPIKTPGLPAARTAPAPASTANAGPARRLPAPKTETARQPASPPISRPPAAPMAAGAWRAQLGAFRDPDGAQRLWGQVAARFPGRQPYFVKAGALTRLLVGPYASQADATRGCGAVKPCVASR